MTNGGDHPVILPHVRIERHHDEIDDLLRESQAEVLRLRDGYRRIARACVEGIVCDDVAWFEIIPSTTLFDFCQMMLDEDLPMTTEQRAKEDYLKNLLRQMIHAAAAAVIVSATSIMPAQAVDLDAQLKNFDGKLFVDADGKPFTKTVREFVEEALLAQFPDETVDGVEKFKRWQLAEKVHRGGVQDFSAEETALIKKLVGKGFPPGVVGPLWIALDPALSSKR